MGDLRSGNGATPDDGGAHGLPEFPPEWGPVIIPDDASELAADVTALNRERRRLARHNRVRALVRRPPLTSGAPGAERTSVVLSLAIMAMAVLVTLISLFAVTWGRAPDGTVRPPASTTPAATGAATDLVDISLADTVGAPARLRTYLPAIVLLVDGCDCGRVVADLAATAPPGVTVVVVGHTIPKLTATPRNVRPLADPSELLTGRYGSSVVPGTATAILLDTPGSITAAVSDVDAASDLTPDQLSRVAAR